jgi:hypothetical protein
MGRIIASPVLALIVAFAAGAQGADPEKSALSWQKQAADTRAAVVSVAEELERVGDQGNEDARGLIVDAKRWLAEGDQKTQAADAKLEAEDFQAASYDYNMAWQYYVKAATAGLNAQRILTGK